MKKVKVIPSVIAQSQAELNKRLAKILPIKPEWIQLDVMDGSFVPNLSLDFDFELPKKHKYEAHLMVKNPEPWFAHSHKQINSVLAHYESQVHLEEFIAHAKGYKKKIGIAISPETDIENIQPYLHWIDKVLIMTVNPGKYGSVFLPQTLDKIKKLKKATNITIQVDGGINLKTIEECSKMGATEFVVGSYLQKASNVKKAYHDLIKATSL